MRTWVLGMTCLVGCYSHLDVIPEVEHAWIGHGAGEIVENWGEPTATSTEGDQTLLAWKRDHRGYTLPSGSASLVIKPGEFDLAAHVQPGEVTVTPMQALALIDGAGYIQRVHGARLDYVRWGPPNDANLRWGFLLGAHAGLGRLDDTGTPLPSGGAYIGGMIDPELGLVGTFSLVAGKDDAGGAMGFAWGFAAQWWPVTRFAMRAGPALMLSFHPGFENAELGPGMNLGASYAVLKSGTFALDLRFDFNIGFAAAFGSLGFGVNIN